MVPDETRPATGRRCRPRALPDDGPRPSTQLAAFFLAGIAFLGAGAIAGIAWALGGGDDLHWLALHLALLGGVSQLVLGAGQFFTCAFLATTPPSQRFAMAEIGAWSAGTVLVGLGVPTGRTPLVDAGAALIAAGLVLFLLALRTMQRRSLQQARWAVRWYQACAVSLGVGALVGVALARGTPWTHGSLLGAHLALNLAGWLGTAIVGTLHTFFPSLTRTELPHPRLQGPTFVAWVSGVALLACGAAWASGPVVWCGWLMLLVAALMLGANVLGSLHAAPVLTLPARLVALGQACLPAGLLLALCATAADGVYAPLVGAPRAALAVLLMAGWIGLTVAGSLLHLLAVLRRVRHRSAALPAPRPATDRLLVAAAGVGIATLAVSSADGSAGLHAPASILVLAVAAVLAARIVVLLWQAVAPRGRSGRPVA